MSDFGKVRKRYWMRDFATIFAHAWYRDFPFQRDLEKKTRRTDWTIHIGVAVRSTADLLGLFTNFESGRTDAILADNRGRAVIALEWEWMRLHNKPNELGKLKTLGARKRSTDKKLKYLRGLRFACFVCYSWSHETSDDLADVLRQWNGASIPLLLVVIQFDREKNQRVFKTMTLYRVRAGKAKLLREQPAYPWEVRGSRWELQKKKSQSD